MVLMSSVVREDGKLIGESLSDLLLTNLSRMNSAESFDEIMNVLMVPSYLSTIRLLFSTRRSVLGCFSSMAKRVTFVNALNKEKVETQLRNASLK